MPTLKYLDEVFDCATAIKGADYIHLLDDNGVMVAAFDAITDFSAFALENGSYVSPTADHSCKVAVIRDDGTIGVGGHTCEDIGNAVPKTRKVNGKPLSADVTITGEDLDGIYSKDAVLTDSTKTLFGLGEGAVPNEVFSFLGKYNLHWWKMRGYGTHYEAFVQEDVETFKFSVPQSAGRDFYYSDAITISQTDGTISLVNPKMIHVEWGKQSNYTSIIGKYVGISAYQDLDTVYKFDTDVTFDSVGQNSQLVTTFKGGTQTIIGIYVEETTDWRFVVSQNPEAYPKSGVVDGFEYVYLGIPLQNAVTPTRIATGSYVGTGQSYNVDYYNSLTFDFEPKLVILANAYSYNGQPMHVIFQNPVKSAIYFESLTVAWTGNTVSWYSSSSKADYQLNTSGKTYYYIAIG